MICAPRILERCDALARCSETPDKLTRVYLSSEMRVASELALGWCTYGVGDHMSHYNVNASVPKTLIQHLVRWVAARGEFGEVCSRALIDVVETEISPELVPGDASGQPQQSSEASVGPYELQDFHLYHTLRSGFAPSLSDCFAMRAVVSTRGFGNRSVPLIVNGVALPACNPRTSTLATTGDAATPRDATVRRDAAMERKGRMRDTANGARRRRRQFRKCVGENVGGKNIR